MDDHARPIRSDWRTSKNLAGDRQKLDGRIECLKCQQSASHGDSFVTSVIDIFLADDSKPLLKLDHVNVVASMDAPAVFVVGDHEVGSVIITRL